MLNIDLFLSGGMIYIIDVIILDQVGSLSGVSIDANEEVRPEAKFS